MWVRVHNALLAVISHVPGLHFNLDFFYLEYLNTEHPNLELSNQEHCYILMWGLCRQWFTVISHVPGLHLQVLNLNLEHLVFKCICMQNFKYILMYKVRADNAQIQWSSLLFPVMQTCI